jgi:hypothetical protein
MAVIASEAALFENAEWSVMAGGLEHKETAYFIARDEIGSRRADGLWSWPLHLAEKRWCSFPAFKEAFLQAIGIYGVPSDDGLAESFEAAGIHRTPYATARRADPPSLWLNERIPISVEAVRSRLPNGSAPLRPSRSRHIELERGPGQSRKRLSRLGVVHEAPWRTPNHAIMRAGTRIARLLRAAWSLG